MTPQEFDETLQALLRRRPYRPFVVELTDGRKIEIEIPEAIAFSNGAGGYLALDEVVFFNFQTVERFAAPAA